MSLRLQALLSVGATFLALFLGLYLVTRIIVLRSFLDYEEQDARRSVQRILAALNDDLLNLKGTARDWAGWDDTYRFIQDLDPGHFKCSTQLVQR